MAGYLHNAVKELKSRPRLFKERITLTQRRNRYPAYKIYQIASTRMQKGWIALSSHYPADKVIHGKVGSINFYPPDKRRRKMAAARQLNLLQSNLSNSKLHIKSRIYRRQLDPLESYTDCELRSRYHFGRRAIKVVLEAKVDLSDSSNNL